MSRWSSSMGLLGCCTRSVNSIVSEEQLPRRGHHQRQSQSSYATAATDEAKHGAVAADGAAESRVTMEPAPELLLDSSSGLLGSLSGRPRTPPRTNDPRENVMAKRAELRQMLTEFTEEASKNGRPCVIVDLKTHGSPEECRWMRQLARYSLRDAAARFVLSEDTQDKLGGDGKAIGSWMLSSVLGVHRAEESALVQTRKPRLTHVVSDEELQRSAVIDFGGRACASRSPLLLIEESVDHRERFVSGMSILNMYNRGAARKAEASLRRDRLQMNGMHTLLTEANGASVLPGDDR